MKVVSIFNHVLGPVMRGPSSSHTAGAFHIGCMARSILGGVPARAVLTFDPAGSYAVTYEPQGADRGFAMGLMGKPLTDESFFTSLSDARDQGLEIEFRVDRLIGADHPNMTKLELTAVDGREVVIMAKSIGGGEAVITRIDNIPCHFTGTAYEIAISSSNVADLTAVLGAVSHTVLGNTVQFALNDPLSPDLRSRILAACPDAEIFECHPVYFVQKGEPLFSSAAELVSVAEENGWTLGETALKHESQLLGLSEDAVIDEMLRRWDIMARSVEEGLRLDFEGLTLLPSCAGKIFKAEADGKLSVRSLHTRAAARALAVMHVDGAMGVVCAAPTGGSAGVIPGAILTLVEERELSRRQTALCLLAAGAIGMILAIRATFAAEVAGCQVEIGASGAMAAAGIVESVGGSAKEGCDAAAVGFQNTMGTVCDLLHGTVEIPCHTRNGAAAASAFVVADMILGGYPNLIPLDETIDAVYKVGQAMPPELRCTSRGGLAVTPSALALTPKCGTCRTCR